MDTCNTDHTLTISPDPRVLALLTVGMIVSAVCALLGIDTRYPRVAPGLLALLFAAALALGWRSWKFDAEGFTVIRCHVLRRQVPWSRVVRIVETDSGGWTGSRKVLLVITDTVQDADAFCCGDPLLPYLCSNPGRVFLIDRGGRYEAEQALDALLRTHWGTPEQ